MLNSRILGFNPTMIRLKTRFAIFASERRSCFNPTMIRLKTKH